MGTDPRLTIPADGDVLARECRWVNGAGAVELTLTVDTLSIVRMESNVSADGSTVSYSQHASLQRLAKKSSPPDTATLVRQNKANKTPPLTTYRHLSLSKKKISTETWSLSTSYLRESG